MMNVNAKIDWHAGMELTAQTFIELDKSLARSQQITHRISNGNHFGVIPAVPFHCQGAFVKKTLEITPLTFMALMPSGKILHIDENVVVDIPILYGKEYYLGCKQGDKMRTFDKERVPFVAPEPVCAIYTLEELEKDDIMPVMKFQVHEGTFSIDMDYLPPCLVVESDSRFQKYIQSFVEKVTVLAEHPNLESGEGKRGMMRYAFLLKNYGLQNRVHHLVQMLEELAQAVDYYIVSPNTENKVELKSCSPYDVGAWLNWLEGYLHGAATILESVVLEDHSIDFEALKAEVKEELYQKLYPELKVALYKDLHDDLKKEIWDELYLSLSDYINGNFKKEIYDLLEGKLSEELYEKLYSTLYEGLYKALYVEPVEEEEEEFVPLI